MGAAENRAVHTRWQEDEIATNSLAMRLSARRHRGAPTWKRAGGRNRCVSVDDGDRIRWNA